jgi:hypothetical protein
MYRVEIRKSQEYEGSELAIFNENGEEPITTLAIDDDPEFQRVYCETTKEIVQLADKFNCFYGPSALLGEFYDWSKQLNFNCSGITGVIKAEMKTSYKIGLYIRDFITAIWAWLLVWWIVIPRVERYIIFMETSIDEDRKKKLPYRLIMKAFRKRINKK